MTTPIRFTREERERGLRRVTQITRATALGGLAAVVGFACAAAATNPGQTTATATTSVGTAPITAALGTLASANYAFSFTNGTLPKSIPAPRHSETHAAAPAKL